MTLSIRAAEAADASLVHSLVVELARYEKLESQVTATPADTAAALFGPHPKAFCDIAEQDGEPVGFALWFYSFSTFRGRHGLYLEDLFVRPVARGAGVGRALLAHLAVRCGREGLARLEWSVLDWNAPALGFYARLGARPVAGWTQHRLDGEPLARLGAGA